MYLSATRLVNLGLPKAFIQLFRMQVHIPYIQTGVTYSSKLGFAILEAFYSMVKQLVPKLQHVISKTVTLMCKASSLCDQCDNWEQQEVWIIQYNDYGVPQRWWSLASVSLGQFWLPWLWMDLVIYNKDLNVPSICEILRLHALNPRFNFQIEQNDHKSCFLAKTLLPCYIQTFCLMFLSLL